MQTAKNIIAYHRIILASAPARAFHPIILSLAETYKINPATLYLAWAWAK
jgi:hypothetical protein